MTTELTNTEPAPVEQSRSKRLRPWLPMFGLSQPRVAGSGTAWIRRRLAALREGVEEALEASKGGNASALVYRAQAQSVVRHELRAAMCTHYLATEAGLTVADRTTLLAAICKATDSRDRVLLSLGIEPELLGAGGKGIIDIGAMPSGEHLDDDEQTEGSQNGE